MATPGLSGSGGGVFLFKKDTSPNKWVINLYKKARQKKIRRKECNL